FSTPSSTIDTYRYLLAIFATCDMATNLGHAAFQPVTHPTSSGLYFFGRRVGIVIGGYSFDTVFCLKFVATFYQTFLILAYHFVARLVTVTSGLTRSFTSNLSPRNWISLGIIVNVLYISVFMAIGLFAFAASE
ncbi:hypothetical protein PMAYCL1PPCAC_11501, partial [Pristionchus mayeri]